MRSPGKSPADAFMEFLEREIAEKEKERWWQKYNERFSLVQKRRKRRWFRRKDR